MKTRTLLAVLFMLFLGMAQVRGCWLADSSSAATLRHAANLEADGRLNEAIEAVAVAALDMQTGVRGWRLLGSPEFRDPYARATRTVWGTLDRLSEKLADEPEGRAAVARVSELLGEWDRTVAAPLLATSPADETDGGVAARALETEGERLMDRVRAAVAELRGVADARPALRHAELKEMEARLAREILLTLVAQGLALLLLLMIVAGLIQRPLAKLAARAARVARGQFEPVHAGGVQETRELARVMSQAAAELDGQRRRAEREGKIVAALATEGSADVLADAALDALVAAYGRAGALWLAPGNDAPLRLAATRGFDARALAAGGPAALEEVRQRRVPLQLEVSDGARVLRTTLVDLAPKRLLVSPLVARGAAVGVVELALNDHSVSEAELHGAIDRVALALRSAQAGDRLEASNRRLDLQRTELETILQTLSEGVILSDVDGIALRCNAAAEAMLGPIVGRGLAGLGQQLQAVQIGGAAPDPAEQPSAPRDSTGHYRIVDATGRSRVLFATSVVVREGDEIRGGVVSFRDVTLEHELKENLARANEELREQNEELRAHEEELRAQSDELARQKQELARRNAELDRASRLKTDFLATMSHELRTPLNAVLGFSELLVSGSGGPLTVEQRGFVGDIHAAGQHLLELINDVLDLSKIEAGRLDLHPEDLDLADAVRAAAQLVTPLARQKQLQLEATLPTGTFLVRADPDRTHQALLNLLSNAVKFTPDGGLVTVTASEDEHAIRLEVRDTGIGIAPEQLARLFQPFTQIETGDARRFGGTGLGLAISRRLVEGMGGEIGVSSVVGGGSVFRLTLPRARAGTVAGAVRSAPAAATLPDLARSPAPVEVASQPVLVVDDDDATRRLVTATLARAGHASVEAASTEEAIRLLEQTIPSLVLVDLGLPGLSGEALVAHLRDTPRLAAVPIGILTARELAPSERLRLEARANFVARKGSLSRGEFVRQVAGALGLPSPAATPRRRVLVIDDSELNRRVVRAMLESETFEVVEADGALDGLRLARAERPDLVLMDLQMPDVDGFEATRLLRLEPSLTGLPIIALTAHAMKGDMERGLAAGLDGYVTKPVGRQTLLDALDRALQPEAREAT